MEKLIRNPLFYLSLALALALGLQVSGIVSAYAPPGGNPPTGGNPAQPLDTSSFVQYKSGNLGVGSKATPNVTLDSTAGAEAIWFNNASVGDSGRIYYSTGKLYYANKDGVGHEIGTGTGAITKIIAGNNITISPTTGVGEVTINATGGGTGGGVGWSLATNQTDIFNSNSGNVGIGTNSPIAKLQVEGNIIAGPVLGATTQNYYEDSWQSVDRPITKSQQVMDCDRDPTFIDCVGSILTQDPAGTVKYDNFLDNNGVAKAEIFVAKSYTVSAGGATGNIKAGDIDLSSPTWSVAPKGFELNEGGPGVNRNSYGGIKTDVYSACPNGYFVTAIRFGLYGDNYIYPVVKCSKL